MSCRRSGSNTLAMFAPSSLSGLQCSEARPCPGGEIAAIELVVEGGGAEEDAVGRAFRPRAVVALRRRQPVHSASHRSRVGTEDFQERQQSPRRHHRLGFGVLYVGVAQAACEVLAPAAVPLLMGDQPLRGAYQRAIVAIGAA